MTNGTKSTIIATSEKVTISRKEVDDMSTQNTDRKLPMKVKVLFPLAQSAPTVQMLIQMYFLVYFHTNILGISATASGMIILIARIWDFINDPLMGILVEKTKYKPGGKCLFWMKRSAPLVAIFMILCYAAPQFSYGLKVVWAAVTYIGLGMSQTAYSIPKDTLFPKLTTDRAERAKLNSYYQIFSNILNAIIPAVTMPLVGVLSGFGENTAFTKLAAIYAVVYLLMAFIGMKAADGYEIEDEEEDNKQASVSAGVMLKTLAMNKTALVVLLMQVVKMLFSSIGGAVLIYFCTYNLGNVNVMSITTSLSMIVSMIPVFFLVWFHKKFGNAGTGAIAAAQAALMFLIMFVIHVSNATAYITLDLLQCLGVTLVSAVLPQCLMDALDYGEWKTGRKDTAVTMSAYGIGTKIGLAFGGSIAAFVIGMIGFDPNAAVQPESVMNTFFNLVVTGQLVVYICMFLLFLYLWKLEKRLPEIRAEIAARKEAQATQTADGTAAMAE